MDDFNVDLSKIAADRHPGVSGMMRVKNDGEFLEASVASCIEALDELIIVYNDCTDDSPQIIEKLSRRYPDKIRIYQYLPNVIAWDLSDEHIANILNGSVPPENTLAGYYNYALSKTSCKYVMKIDADQIYNAPLLKILCDCYRSDSRIAKLSTKGYIYVYLAKILSSLSFKLHMNVRLLKNKRFLVKYQEYLLEFIKKHKVSISLSGINAIILDSHAYVSLGKYCPGEFNILGPFNGIGDHLIFEVNKDVRFIPVVNDAYNILNGGKKNVIEFFVGKQRNWIFYTPMWLHLNACRKRLWHRSIQAFKEHNDRYVPLKEFTELDFNNYIGKCDDEIADERCRMHYKYLFAGISQTSVNYFSELARELQKNVFDRLYHNPDLT